MFQDIEPKNFWVQLKDFWYWYWEGKYLVLDNTEYQNYIATTLKEFTTFFYVFTFFLFMILNYYFIKSLLYNNKK